jgi:hypothetical protein
MIFAQLGKHLCNGSVTLLNGTLSLVIFTPVAAEWTDVYSIVATTDETATETLTISDGTTTLTYYVGGTTGQNTPLVYQSSIPVRFRKGTAITVSVNAVTAGKHIAVNIRGLTSTT